MQDSFPSASFGNKRKVSLPLEDMYDVFLCSPCLGNREKWKIVVHLRVFLIIDRYTISFAQKQQFPCIGKEKLMGSDKQCQWRKPDERSIDGAYQILVRIPTTYPCLTHSL